MKEREAGDFGHFSQPGIRTQGSGVVSPKGRRGGRVWSFLALALKCLPFSPSPISNGPLCTASVVGYRTIMTTRQAVFRLSYKSWPYLRSFDGVTLPGAA